MLSNQIQFWVRHIVELDERLFYIKFQPPKFIHVVVMMKNVNFIFFPTELKILKKFNTLFSMMLHQKQIFLDLFF